MNDLFHNHGKKILAVVGVMLALTFLLPGNVGNGGPGNTRLGTLNGRHVTADELRDAQNLLHSVDRLIVSGQSEDGRPTAVPLPQQMFMAMGVREGQYGQIKQNPLLIYLLLAEARRAGAAVDDRLVDSLFIDPNRIAYDPANPMKMSDASDALKSGLREDTRRLMSIWAFRGRLQGAFKFSRPLVDETVARADQQVKLRVAAFDGKDFAARIAAPTDDELRRQFDAYAAVAPQVTDANPFGFGYRVPDRVAAQWLLVPDAEVKQKIDADKSAQEWDVQARVYYRKNPDSFMSTPGTGATPATKPATRPYAEVAADALKAVKEPEVERLRRKAAAAIVQQLNADYQKAARTPATQQAASGFGPAFGSFEYLEKLADNVQKQTGVRPTAVAPAGLLTREELAKQPGVGKATLPDPMRGSPDAADVVFAALKAFQQGPTAVSVELGQPSPVLIGNDGLYVVRVTAAEPSHPARQLADVAADAQRDVRRSKAYNAAEEAARAALAKAGDGLDKLGVAVQTGDFYGVGEPGPAGLPDKLAGGVIGPAFEALRGVASPDALPVRTIARLKSEGVAAVVEVTAVRTSVNTAIEPQVRQQAIARLARGMVPYGIPEQWLNIDNVSRRVGYVPEKSNDAPADPRGPLNPNSPNHPANPLMPG